MPTALRESGCGVCLRTGRRCDATILPRAVAA